MIRNVTRNINIAINVTYCTTFFQKGLGLMFRRPIMEDQAFVFNVRRESVFAAAITMFFVFFPITVIWLNGEKRVVDRILARPWRLIYVPQNPARYFIEAHPAALNKVDTGDLLTFYDIVW